MGSPASLGVGRPLYIKEKARCYKKKEEEDWNGVACHPTRQRLGWPAELGHPSRHRRAARGSDYESTEREMDNRR